MTAGVLAEARAAASAAVNAPQRPAKGPHEAGEKLIFRSKLDYELLLLFAKNELSTAVATPLLAVIVAVGAMFWAPPAQLLLWLATVFLAKGLLINLCRQFLRTPQEDADPPAWRTKMMAAEFLYGLSWAAVAFVSAGSAGEAAHTFVFAALLIVISMRMLFAAPVMPIVYAGTLPMAAAVVIRFALLDNPYYWAMAAMAIGVYVYFIWLMSGTNATVTAMLGFRTEKDALIAELEQAKSISDEARARAEEANQAKSRFLATMSHELRTPLNAILGFSEIMRSEILGTHENPVYKEYANDIHQSGQHLLNLINEILDISRIESGRYELHEAPLMLAAVAEDCQRLTRLRSETKELRIVEDFEPGLPQIFADERAIRQICLNLLSNAIKFTPAGGTITLSIGQTRDGGQFLSVKDTGPGIPENEIPRVLKSFGQGSLAHQTAEGGTGLGLPITKGLAELHDGTFELKSRLRHGTEVMVTFPRKRVIEPLPRSVELARWLKERQSSATSLGASAGS
ncbi:MAG TPA: HAMP domain-containing sensor histidine kinase [Methyloceanibacter sp.]|nr:HAMP domain-containing sensor histidine kinase [Methyloceanibacter sp.]